MKTKIKKVLLQSISCFLMMITVSSVNSMCFFCFGQAKEPEQLKRFKK